MRPAEVDVLRGDSSKALSELGWKPKYQLEERLETTIKWYINNKKWSQELINKLKMKVMQS